MQLLRVAPVHAEQPSAQLMHQFALAPVPINCPVGQVVEQMVDPTMRLYTVVDSFLQAVHYWPNPVEIVPPVHTEQPAGQLRQLPLLL